MTQNTSYSASAMCSLVLTIITFFIMNNTLNIAANINARNSIITPNATIVVVLKTVMATAILFTSVVIDMGIDKCYYCCCHYCHYYD